MTQPLIYDVGMHTGQDTDYYLKKGFRVIAVEANPALCADAAINFSREIETGQLILVPKAIAAGSGTISFFINKDRSVWGTASAEYAANFAALGAGSEEIAVEAVTMAELLDTYGMPYYMKVDIEGLDHLCIEALVGRPQVPDYVSIESHQHNLLETLGQLETLKAAGYKHFDIVLQNDTHKQVCPRPALEGHDINHTFPVGATGLFGRELPGPWLTFDEAVRSYRRIYRNIAVTGPHTGIFRNVNNRLAKAALVRIFPGGTGWYDTHARNY
jgi:FkbM family methyltransferase